MFDLRPCNREGDLDLQRIQKVREFLDLRENQWIKKEIIKKTRKKRNRVLGESQKDDFILKLLDISGEENAVSKKDIKYRASASSVSCHPNKEEIMAVFEEIERMDNSLKELILEASRIEPQKTASQIVISDLAAEQEEAVIVEVISQPAEETRGPVQAAKKEIGQILSLEPDLSVFQKKEPEENLWRPLKINEIFFPELNLKRRAFSFATAGFFILLIISGLSLAGRGIVAKKNILTSAMQAYRSMMAAKDSVSGLDFSSAESNFQSAYQSFLQAEQELNKMGRSIIFVLERMPGGSAVASAGALVEAGENLAQAGKSFSQIAGLFSVDDIGGYFSGGQPLTSKITGAKADIKTAKGSLQKANTALAGVNNSDLPSDLVESVELLKQKLPVVAEAVSQVDVWSDAFLEFLGHKKAKKYLLVFQNNSEARPTGGFIGTYGILDLDEGRIKNLFIDGVFDLDGQLVEKIIPPAPIQKISTAWSMHDANWFADFPSSAKKVSLFYEKAGGETVDGVISLTPTVMEKLLALTGPIEMPQYGVVLTSENFLDTIQYKVEVDYDKKLNEPKKILADFAPVFLDRLWQVWPEKSKYIISAISESLSQKHILFYFSDEKLQSIFSGQNWTGEILNADKDYLSVVNANINGYKTDKVISQKIYHTSRISEEGEIINSVKITRIHAGGKSSYDWYNKVNADYMRVYVPLGSELISAKGHTLETVQPPIDYEDQKFKTDYDVAAQESGIKRHSSGTQIFFESGKTVFGNWVYVSPGETVEVVYEYKLPFKIDLAGSNSSYSLLVQKQSGAFDCDFESEINLPESAKVEWKYPETLKISGRQIKISAKLKTDNFAGVVIGNSH